jgi:hypothetical protein
MKNEVQGQFFIKFLSTASVMEALSCSSLHPTEVLGPFSPAEQLKFV